MSLIGEHSSRMSFKSHYMEINDSFSKLSGTYSFFFYLRKILLTLWSVGLRKGQWDSQGISEVE